MSERRRLTDRQAAVLAAVERLGDPSIPDLRDQFPDLAPSAVAKVLEALESRGLVERAGEPNQIYLGGVRFWSTALSPTEVDKRLRAVHEAIEAASLPFHSWIDPDRRTITVLVPLERFQADLLGDAEALRDLRAQLQSVLFNEAAVTAQLASEVASPEGRPCLMVVLRLRD